MRLWCLCLPVGTRCWLSLVVALDERDRRIDLDVLRAGGNEDLRQLALIDRLDLHCRLVGLDLGDDVAGFDGSAFADKPLGQRALLHGGRQRRHQNLGRHLPVALRCQTKTSVVSSDGSGSGSASANSAAAFTSSRTFRSTDFSSSSPTPASTNRARTCSIGSCVSRTRCTSSRVRYLAGSDIECPRYL